MTQTMNAGIGGTLQELTRLAWEGRLDPRVHTLALRVTGTEARRQDKMRALVDDMHRRYDSAASLDADDACLFVASAAMSVGIRCRFFALRYGAAWTCRVAYEVGDHWERIDPLRQHTEREPDETVIGPIPDTLEGP